ncbi:MAG: hypothetical protein INQ03_24260 [Candidatus Heimdallarchaeota archaeon]|nr:hypothetical protein [Candidatus Heimdallarchaeota archaeon]
MKAYLTPNQSDTLKSLIGKLHEIRTSEFAGVMLATYACLKHLSTLTSELLYTPMAQRVAKMVSWTAENKVVKWFIGS